MHMADALITPAVGATMYVLSTTAAGTSVYKLKKEDTADIVPVMGVMGAFVFASQMINFTIPGTGSSGHLCGGMLLTALLGPYAAFITMISVLLIQALMFADGGLLALGCNIWNMAFYSCFLGAFLVWRPVIKTGFTKRKIVIASVAGSVITLQLGALSVCIETFLSGITELPFSVFVMTMQPIHLAIGTVEGLITAAVLVFIYEARPELLYGYSASDFDRNKSRLSLKATVITIAVTALVTGGGLSLAASEHPDGLEWSIEKLTGDTELSVSADASHTAAYEKAQELQNKTAILPDYSFKGSDSELGVSFSGVFGSLTVVAMCCAICAFMQKLKKKNTVSD